MCVSKLNKAVDPKMQTSRETTVQKVFNEKQNQKLTKSQNQNQSPEQTKNPQR